MIFRRLETRGLNHFFDLGFEEAGAVVRSREGLRGVDGGDEREV